jgi:chaperonin GroES
LPDGFLPVRIFVRLTANIQRTAAGILIPESSQEKLNEGKVVAVGPGAPDRDGKIVKPSLKEGDAVLLPQFGGSAIKLGGEVRVVRSRILLD